MPPHLYSRGSAIIGTVQQVAGAAGTALFITVLSVSAPLTSASGGSPFAAQSAGVHQAFLVGAIMSLAVIVAALFIRKPAR